MKYIKFICIKCFVDCVPSEDNTCGNCWKVGDKVTDGKEEFQVTELYTLHWYWGTMTGVKDSNGSYYEYFNQRLKRINV